MPQGIEAGGTVFAAQVVDGEMQVHGLAHIPLQLQPEYIVQNET